jgi:hypothetical protein
MVTNRRVAQAFDLAGITNTGPVGSVKSSLQVNLHFPSLGELGEA